VHVGLVNFFLTAVAFFIARIASLARIVAIAVAAASAARQRVEAAVVSWSALDDAVGQREPTLLYRWSVVHRVLPGGLGGGGERLRDSILGRR
jgi:hypothetical protein